MRKQVVFLVLGSLAVLAVGQPPSPSTGLLGFSAESAKTEQDWENRFRAIPDAARVHANMVHLAAHPHNVGSEYQRENAEWLVARYKEWGWDAHIERFDVLIPLRRSGFWNSSHPLSL